MKKAFALYFLLFTSYSCLAQMQPADSLLGTYAGEYYYASPPTNPWTITQDTIFVTNIDSANCLVQIYGNFSIGGIYYTDYFSCNGTAPSNHYIKFYNQDSLRYISDSTIQPPPNPPISWRFYGRRISNQVTGINELLNNEQVSVYPNPCSDVLNIELTTTANKNYELQIIDLVGREVRYMKMYNGRMQISVVDLNQGIYFLQVRTDEGVITKKIVIEY